MKKATLNLSGLLNGDFSQSNDVDINRRVKLLNLSSFLGILFIIIFIFLNLVERNLITFYALIIFLISFLSAVFVFRFKKNPNSIIIFKTANLFILFLYLIFYDNVEHSSYIWSFFFPHFCIVFFGIRKGVLITTIFFTFTVLGLIIPLSAFNANQYSSIFILRYITIFFLFSIISFYSEYLRIKSAEELIFKERRYNMLLSKGTSVYAIINSNGDVLYESPSIKEVYGYDPEELEGTNIFELVHPEDREKAFLEFSKLFEEPGRTGYVVVRYKHKEGSYRDIEVVGLNLIDDPAINGIILTSHDITRLKQAERDINLLNENLEKRITERTNELLESQEQLRHSEKMKAIGQLAGGVAHDFNNQLTGILGFADLIRISSSQNDEIYNYADAIVKTTQKASDLVKQLLTFARKGEYQLVVTDIHEIITEVITLLKRTVDKNIKIHSNFQSEISQSLVDPSHLHNALLNLGINARDAMPDGGDIIFSTKNVFLDNEFCSADHCVIMPGEYVLIEVIDKGSGIADENIEQIFEPFFTTKKCGEGSGMGLAAVYGTVERHGGTIKVRSVIGKGSTFEIYLPVSQEKKNSEDIVENKTVLHIEKSNILVVDDEEAVFQAIAEILKREGHKVKIFQDGTEALGYYKKFWQEIDLVILDIVMPGIKGNELFEHMIKLNPKTRIVLSSGYSFNNNIEKLISSGAISFLQKPFSIDELIKHVNNALK